MSFGDSVRALLDTYANCILLLKSFGRNQKDDGAVEVRQQRSRLRKALRTDRLFVEQAYSSKLSASGSRFKEGDARSVKALDRVLKKLRNAITRVLCLPRGKDGLDLDYRSLMSLSNGSRTEAIRAINSLSRRLASPSRSSLTIPSHTKSSPKASSSKNRQSLSPKAASSSSKPSSKPSKTKQRSQKKFQVPAENTKRTTTDTRLVTERTRNSPQSQLLPPLKPLSTGGQPKTPRIGSSGPRSSIKTPSSAGHRVSMLSFSSDSTKLGEIPPRKWRSVTQNTTIDPNGYEHNVRPVFPLRPYTDEVKKRRLFGLFGRKREA
ncbi:hypothetical protein VTG60DRAFT_5851 [Thermothelomyces hinnuleus]